MGQGRRQSNTSERHACCEKEYSLVEQYQYFYASLDHCFETAGHNGEGHKEGECARFLIGHHDYNARQCLCCNQCLLHLCLGL